MSPCHQAPIVCLDSGDKTSFEVGFGIALPNSRGWDYPMAVTAGKGGGSSLKFSPIKSP